MTTPARPSGRPSDRPRPARPLRRDAQRNRDAILAAARQVFCDHGLEAPRGAGPNGVPREEVT